MLDGFRLVRVKLQDAAPFERCAQPAIERRPKRRVLRGDRREPAHRGDMKVFRGCRVLSGNRPGARHSSAPSSALSRPERVVSILFPEKAMSAMAEAASTPHVGDQEANPT